MLANPFDQLAESAMVEHMNNDHAAAIAHYVKLAGLPSSTPAELVGIDAEGFHLRIGHALYWLGFAQPCSTPVAVRQALVALAHAERWPDSQVTNGEPRT